MKYKIPEINYYIYGQLNFNKGASKFIIAFLKYGGGIDIFMQKDSFRLLAHTIHKTIQILKENLGANF